ncbi:MAG: hypothetical protein HUU08_17325 [Candidatus Brocadia sp.]|nr:hypothetical protein [Candidatus Brocadia sp.]
MEKCFKAVLEEHKLRISKIHSLVTLYEDVKKVYSCRKNYRCIERIRIWFFGLKNE